MVRLSICMMVKNEAANLRRCLESLKNLRRSISNELIIIDTGSTDETVDIAKEYTEQIYFHEWNNHFSEMRNKSISYAKGEWILIIDADEELVNDKDLITFLKNNDKRYIAALLELNNVSDNMQTIISTLKTVRIFKNDGKVKYEGSVHNIPVILGDVLEIKSLLMHYGYNLADKDLMDRKFERTTKLLLLELEKDPLNIYYRFQLATSYDMHEDLDLAFVNYERAYNDFKINKLNSVEYHYLFAPYAKILVSNKNYLRAVEIVLEGLEVEPDNIDLLYFGAVAYMFLKELDKGIDFFCLYLKKIEVINTLPISINPSIQLFTLNNKDECFFNLAQAYLMKGDWNKVIMYSQKVLEEADENSEYFLLMLNTFIKAAVIEKKGDLIKELYKKYPVTRWNSLDDIVYASAGNIRIDDESYLELFNCLGSLPSEIGKMYTTKQLKFDSLKIEKIYQIEQNLLELIQRKYDEALYLALEASIDLSDLMINCDELAIMEMFSDLNDKYAEFRNLVVIYLNQYTAGEEYTVINWKRILIKYLALTSFGKENARSNFKEYIEIGMNLLTKKYQKDFLCITDIQNLKNSEEQFLLCAWRIKNEKNVDRSILFKQAVSCFPEWEDSLYLWLENEFSMNNNEWNDEFEILIDELKAKINYLISQENYSDALDIITEYLLINSNDLEILSLKSELMVKLLSV